MFEIDQIIPVTITRKNEPNLDIVTGQAYLLACSRFGLDDAGYFTYVKDSERGDSIIVDFQGISVRGSMEGIEHIYTFNAKVTRLDDDD
jgi:hypothetical protein